MVYCSTLGYLPINWMREQGFFIHAGCSTGYENGSTKTLNAKDVINNASKDELTQIIRKYGEESWAGRIADFICEIRRRKEITTTGELVKIIKAAIPARARRRVPSGSQDISSPSHLCKQRA